MARPPWSFVAALGLSSLVACGGAPKAADPLSAMREAAAESTDGELLGRLVLGEMFAPGGEAARAIAARKRLDQVAPNARGMFASLGRSIDDEVHGRFTLAAKEGLAAIVAAKTSQDPDAPLVGWFAASHMLNLRTGVANLWPTAKEAVNEAIDHPGNLGWRARSELVEWWTLDGFRDDKGGDATKAGLLEEGAKRYGCATEARMAGPFGHLSVSDHRVHYEAERPGPWPGVFAKDARRMEAPRVIKVERLGCGLHGVNASGNGIFYVETFLDMRAEQEIIIAAQGSFAVYVDDLEVMTRDPRTWGIWPRFGAHVKLGAGRHRLLARVGGFDTSIRVLAADGTPADVAFSTDASQPYSMAPPEVLADANALEPFMTALGVPRQRGAPKSPPRDTDDPISRMLASYLAHLEGQNDVAAVLLEPLVKDPKIAAGPALALSAGYFDKDPIYPQADGRHLAQEARDRAATKDPELWWPRLWLALDGSDKSLPDVAPKVQALADHFTEVPDILKGLAAIYAKVGWRVEHVAAVKEAARRFPDDAEALGALLHVYDVEGRVGDADKLAERIKKLDKDNEIDFERAVERRDYKAAIAELQRLGKARKDRRDIAARIADLETRAGKESESLEKLEAAARKAPEDAGARLAVADLRFARGDKSALSNALVEAIQKGADTNAIREAIELVEGVHELSAYRLDGRRIIAEFEASMKAKSRGGAEATMPGTAARVLDYSAIRVHEDGSARMLEHEIIGIQSREAIQEHAEQRPRGLALKIRTIKKDGRVLEPEVVEGKPTVTMPHLEVGDYIETEWLVNLRGDGAGGRLFEGPRWFFREEKIPYWRSEFVVVTPKTRKLDVETAGTGVPAPTVSESGALVTRRWRVDKSPALPEEPGSAPIQEFLPSVRIGWGISLADTILRLVDAAGDETPRDPRLAKVAAAILRGDKDSAPATTIDERAKRFYRWVLANIEEGRENDGRRAVIGKSGNRTEAFLYLCRLSGIDAHLGLVRDRLTAPPVGPMSDAEQFSAVAVRLETEQGARWMIVHDKFAPYGYLPSSMRGQPAVVLREGAPRETTSTVSGAIDGVTHEGTVTLAADGSAKIDLEQRYEGKLAIHLRGALDKLAGVRLKETIESRLLPQSFPGARVISLAVKNLADVDAPLVLAMRLEMSSFARPVPGQLVVEPPFPIHLTGLAELPSRETPLYIAEEIATHVTVRLRIKLPEGAKVLSPVAAATVEDDGRSVRVGDHLESSGALLLERSVDLPAARVQPAAYGRFQEWARKGDALLHRDVVISTR